MDALTELKELERLIKAYIAQISMEVADFVFSGVQDQKAVVDYLQTVEDAIRLLDVVECAVDVRRNLLTLLEGRIRLAEQLIEQGDELL